MRILVVAQFYPPEAGASQNRAQAFVTGLLERGHQVTVVCQQPNHPAGVFHEGYGRRLVQSERAEALTVHRLWVAASPRKTTKRRLLFYGSFALGAFAAVHLVRRHDVAFTTSPPLPGVLASACGLMGRNIPYVVDVRDIWPAAAVAVGELSNGRALQQIERAERWLYRNASGATATTRPFCRHVDRVAERAICTHLPNGALDQLVNTPPPSAPTSGPFTAGYVGNLGVAQGLTILLEAAEALRNEDVRVLVVGDGPLAYQLREESRRRKLTGIEMRPAVPVEEVGRVLAECHALIVPLRPHSLFGDFVPSKLYDAMAVERPVIAALAGEGARLVREARCGLVVPPGDGAALANAIRTLKARPDHALALGRAGRKFALTNARSRQLDNLEAVLMQAAGYGVAPRPTSPIVTTSG